MTYSPWSAATSNPVNGWNWPASVPPRHYRPQSLERRASILAREGTEITRITSPKRTIPAGLRRWVERAYPRCGHLGCGSRERLQIDHVVPVEERGPTEKGNLWRLCPYHHKLKTFYGWRAVGPQGERQLVPPDQPERGPP